MTLAHGCPVCLPFYLSVALWKDGLWQLYAPVATGPGAELAASKISTLD